MDVIGSIVNFVRTEWRYRRARAELGVLDDRMLKDIGVTRGEINNVARRAAETGVRESPGKAPHGVPALGTTGPR